MKPKQLLLIVVAVVAVGGIVFALSRPASAGIQDVDAAGVKAAVAAGDQIIDVRTAGEFQMGHIPGAVNVPVDQLAAAAESWDREATYVVYCATGSRSLTAIDTMKSMGFTSIKHYASGIQSWDGDLEQGTASTNQTVETAGKPVMIEFFTDA